MFELHDLACVWERGSLCQGRVFERSRVASGTRGLRQ